MTTYRSAIALLAVAGCSGGSSAQLGPDAGAPGDATVAPDAAPVVLTGTPIVASAALGTGDALLGTTADDLFNQVNGDVLFAPRGDGSGGLAHTPVNQITIGWIEAENTTQIAANLGGWGLGSAALAASNTTRYMSMRAYQIDYDEDVDLTMAKATATGSAVYFVSKIYFGHSYEALFSGTQSTFTAAVAAQLPQATGSISATASSDNLTATNVGRGLTPNSGAALFSANQADVMANYSAAGPSVPIYVEYRLIPGVSEPPGTTIPWQSTTKATIAIEEVDVFHNGAFLDASDTAWTVTASCKINGAVLDQDDAVWQQSRVSAGGTDVSGDGTGPQDPDTGDPSSTYGRYASLPFTRSYPVNQGNTLECDLGGDRTDPSTPVPLPSVIISVPVDTGTPVDGRAGNYDAGNDLDYEVHYTVTYSPN